jgi:trehalose 6-phosphate synthase
VDRLDYSKGIPERLRSFSNALERFDELRGKVALVQVVVPSREAVPEYQALKAEIEGLVGEISGKFSQAGWTPIRYMFRSLERDELLAYYRAADIALVTPLRDGMNLIAKEYCAANVDNNGVLILSEFAGAATQLRTGALVVNPYDIEGVANAIYQAYSMSPSERQSRMRRLRQSIAKRDIFWWVNFFLWAATTHSLDAPWPSRQSRHFQ